VSDVLVSVRDHARAEQRRREARKAQKLAAEADLFEFGKMMWHVLEPAKPLAEGWPLRVLCDMLMAVSDGHHQRVIINIPPGSGKALDSDTPVLTTWGWKRHGDLAPGDFVFGPDGLPKRVLACTPETIQRVFTVRFDDRTELVATGEHLWPIERDDLGADGKWRRARKPMVVPTSELLPSARSVGGLGPDRIQIAASVKLPPRRLLIDPYTLGAWLGDGTAIAAELCVGDEDIHHFAHLGNAGVRKPKTETHDAIWRVGLPQVYGLLRALDLLGNKHIPGDYLESSIGQRVALLQGLMDTDGTVDKGGACSFANSNALLIGHVEQLVCSLGMKAFVTSKFTKLNGKLYGPHYTIRFTPPPGLYVFRLARKIARVKSTTNKRTLARYIEAIEPAGDRLAKCISVEGEIYLAGRQLAPTHNSLWLNVFWPAWEWGPNNMPHLRYLSASYSQGLPERDNIKTSRLVNSMEYQALWGDRVKLRADGMELVENTQTGWKRVTSTRSGTTGHRADRVLIDDANDPKTVESDPVRYSTKMWLTEIMPDRLTDLDTGVIINLQQRTNEEDATGVLCEMWEGSDFTWLMIPMEFDPVRSTPVVLRRDEDGEPIEVWRDPRGLDADGNELEGIYEDENGTPKVRMGSPMAHADGALCWPERYPPHTIPGLKKGKGAFAWAGQYNQSPTVRGGDIIRREWWQAWNSKTLPDLGTRVASLDTAIKEGEENDFNAFTSWGAFEDKESTPKLLLTSAWRMRSTLAELIRRTAESCYERGVDYLLIEDKARGHDVAQEIATQYADAPWQTILIPANGRGAFSGDKRARLEAVSAMFSGDVRKMPLPGSLIDTIDVWSGGMIYAPDLDWAQDVIDEVCGFPGKAHDDYVDSVSMALSWVRRHGLVVRKVEHERAELELRKFKRRPGVPYAVT
jgi:phage terminase large subunit-like protein